MRFVAKRVAFGLLGIAAATLALGGLRSFQLGREIADLKLQTDSRNARLAENQKIAKTVPDEPAPAALDRSRSIARLRSTLVALSQHHKFSIDEFQAGTEEVPYLTVYSTDDPPKGWVQVSVRALLTGHTPALMSGLAELRQFEVPFEIDSVELTRRGADNSGTATVAAQVQMRVLVYKGDN